MYHELLAFLPSDDPLSVMEFRVTNNVITSQVASMLTAGMLSSSSSPQNPLSDSTPIPLKIQPSSIDSLEPSYTCPAASALLSLYGPGSNASSWQKHLSASRALFAELDAISGVASTDEGWHKSWDHYFDNLSARLCHAKPLPCNSSNGGEEKCVTQAQASTVFRLGQYEYSRLWRAAPESLAAATAGYGVWVAEVAENIRAAIAAAGDAGGKTGVRYRHNVAHDGSVSRLLAVLQVDVMVWPGMGSEIVFEVYTKKKEVKETKAYVRVLWGGQVLRSSHPDLGALDMLDAEVLLAYLDGLVGKGASKVRGLCGLE